MVRRVASDCRLCKRRVSAWHLRVHDDAAISGFLISVPLLSLSLGEVWECLYGYTTCLHSNRQTGLMPQRLSAISRMQFRQMT